ncbi:MAG: DNA ligase D [Thermodesulfobacteriota bacterium]
MDLATYRQKRDFSRTSEPAGLGQALPAGRRFVVHQHAARRLHYDLRLELDGVLKSWAVPKGPSLDPFARRLAVQVEDHPLEYGGFEGVIPKDQYGGGTVVLWDQGTWEPEADPREGLRQGKLSFWLHGEKLRGSYALVQMRSRDGSPTRNWLLIKHRDAAAVPGSGRRILDDKPASAASGRSLAEIAAAAGDAAAPSLAASALPQARPAPQPAFLSPQLATLVSQPPTGDAWIHEIKLDGYRILAVIAEGRITLRSRHGKDWTGRFPAVVAALAAWPVSQAILDGEIVIIRPDGTSDFQALQEALRSGQAERIVYCLFDLPHCAGYDLAATPLLERKRLLASLIARLPPESGIIRASDHIQANGPEVFRQACDLGTEGLVSKEAASPYEPRRSRTWLKTTCRQRQELVVGGWSEPAGGGPGFGALLVGYFDQGELRYAGRVGTGFSRPARRQLGELLPAVEQPRTAFVNPPTGAAARGLHWTRPALVAEVAFRGWTRDQVLRLASFQGLRHDKPPEDVGRETPEPLRPPPVSSVVVAGIRVTHADKILYPEAGITKRDLAAFYAAIADRILPHVRHRPLTLVRCPDGWPGECFYQKHLGRPGGEPLPAALRTVPIPDRQGTRAFVVIDDLAGLIALVQLGVLEIHPWGASAGDWDRPDRLVFDLDPGPGLAWQQVVAAARLLRRRLAELGLAAFVKTSGGKGLHLVVPLVPWGGWREVRAFARAVALQLARQRPDLFVATMSRAQRQGRIFIDYLRNSRGATAVAAYSPRARPGAPVSTPVRWEELGEALTPDRYRIDNLPRRLAALQSDPWPDFFALRQKVGPAAR